MTENWKNRVISVIIPAYNSQHELEEALGSISKQLGYIDKIIVVDDCSPIKISIPKKYQHLRLELVRNKNNFGPAKSREIGLRMSNTKYVCFFDSDELVEPTFFTKLVEALETNPSKWVAYCGGYEFDPTSDTPLTASSKNSPRSHAVVSNRVELEEYLLTTLRRPWGTTACVWKSEKVKKHGKWIETKSGEDFYFDVHMALSGCQPICIDENLVWYRKGRPDSLSNQKNCQIYRDRLTVQRKIYGELREHQGAEHTMFEEQFFTTIARSMFFGAKGMNLRLLLSAIAVGYECIRMSLSDHRYGALQRSWKNALKREFKRKLST